MGAADSPLKKMAEEEAKSNLKDLKGEEKDQKTPAECVSAGKRRIR
jgi:hypothetical protein